MDVCNFVELFIVQNHRIQMDTVILIAPDWNFRRLRFGTMYENDWWGMNIQFRMENMVNRPNTVTTTTNVVTAYQITE